MWKSKCVVNFLNFWFRCRHYYKLFKKNNWNWNYESDINDHIIHLFFMRLTSQKLWLKNHEVLIMNFTYKTNRYKMLLLIIENQIVLNINFYVAFCFMAQKKVLDYTWILNNLIIIYRFHRLPNSTMIVIDMKADMWFMHLLNLISLLKCKALLIVISVIFFDSNHLLCIWHINNNVLSNCRKKFDTKKKWKIFFFEWKTIMYAKKMNFESNEDNFLWNIMFIKWWSIWFLSTSFMLRNSSNVSLIEFYISTLQLHFEKKMIMQYWKKN